NRSDGNEIRSRKCWLASFRLESTGARWRRDRRTEPIGRGRVFRQAREDKVPKIAIRLLAAIAALLAGLSAGAAGAAEIKVVCAGAMRAVLQELGPAFEKSSGHKLVIEYATAAKVEEKVAADEEIDVAILTKP